MDKVLIVDDSAEFLDLLGEQVRRLGYEVETAASLRDAQRQIAHFEPAVVFLDVDLPDGSGLDAIERIKQAPSSPEVIIVTGEGTGDGAAMAIGSGAWDYLQKGHTLNELVLPLSHAVEYRKERLASIRARALDLEGIIGKSPRMRQCFDFLAEAASDDANVLIFGETGTGKELFARAIHRNSGRREGPFVVVDCAVLPEKLVESMLFGHRKGAFTGADSDQTGLVKQADGGTLFLDEIGEMPMTIQKAFLRVLQERRFRPIGFSREVSSDFRLIAATNRDLEAMVRQGTFREDLLFRVRAHVIELPALRERSGDVLEIAQHFIAQIGRQQREGTKGASTAFFSALEHYDWPGNVRELGHALERAITAASGHQVLHPIHLPPQIRASVARGSVDPALNTGTGRDVTGFLPLKEAKKTAEKNYLMGLMDATDGDIDKACKLANVSRSRLYALLKEHDIVRPD